MGIVIDALVLIFIIISFIIMSKKGFVKAVYSICGHIITFVLVFAFLTPATKMIKTTPLGDIVSDNVSKIILKQNETGESCLAPIIEENILSEGVNSILEASVTSITDIVMKILTGILLFILLRLVIALLFGLLDTIFKIPGLSQLNRFTGGIAGIINSLLVIYVICGILSLNFEWANHLRGFVDETTVLKYFYINNLLINLFI